MPQKPARRAEAVGLQTGRSTSGWGAPGRFPCPLRGQTRPKPLRSQHWLPPSRGPPSRAGRSGPPRSSPFRPGQPSVRQLVPNSVHTERLPAPAGSSSSAGQEVWPPPTHTHPLARLRAGLLQSRRRFHPGGRWPARARKAWLGEGRHCGLLPPTHPLSAFVAPWSAKPEKRGQSILGVTSLLPYCSGWGSYLLSAEISTCCNAGKRERKDHYLKHLSKFLVKRTSKLHCPRRELAESSSALHTRWGKN